MDLWEVLLQDDDGQQADLHMAMNLNQYQAAKSLTQA
jgi:hypothetical protein